jgi:hypothetical protein
MSRNRSIRCCRIQPVRLMFIIAALAVAPIHARAVRQQPREPQKDFAALLTQAKLQADLGNHQQAVDAFSYIVRDVTAPATIRNEAMVRLGLALNATGNIGASTKVFKDAATSSSADPKNFRFLIYAVARTVPGKIWPTFRAPFEELLKTGEVVTVEELGREIAPPKRVYLKKEEMGLKTIWKPFPPAGKGARGNYRSDIAAYELDKMLGLDMVPPTVERIIEGRPGNIQLWINGCRLYKDLQRNIPTTSDWKHQVSRMNLFDALIGNTGRDAGNNLLVDPNWDIVLVDHLLAFSNETELRNPPDQFDRRLVTKLRTLREDDLETRLKGILSEEDIRNILIRRDALLAHLSKLIADKGESAVLF